MAVILINQGYSDEQVVGAMCLGELYVGGRLLPLSAWPTYQALGYTMLLVA